MAKREFLFEKRVYLTDTNAEGNTYFARYFEWQGMAREEFFRQVISDPKKFLQNVKVLTLEASLEFKNETRMFDEVIIKIKPTNPKITTFDLKTTFINKNTKQLIAEGKQKLGFTDIKGNIIPIPDEFKEKGMDYLDESEIPGYLKKILEWERQRKNKG